MTSDFEDLFPEGFLEQWRQKIATEYRLDAGQRAYCGHKTTNEDGETEICNGFLGSKGRVGSKCPKCKQLCCCKCLQPVKRPYEQHRCGEANAPDPLGVRGTDYQACPKCEQPSHRQDGCNAIVCPTCYQNYCYLCGIKAHHDSRHWRPSVGCTRWNLPTDPNPGYDKELDRATAIVRREGEDDE
ncbi:hypothetical protein LTR95_018714, partial [Oleoguttula sp. CCFEE 5521]